MKKVLFLFGELNDVDIDWLIAQGTTVQITKGSVLIQEGQPITALYIVLDGLFGVSLGGAPGREIAQMPAGEVLGEISFLDSRPPTATVQALADSIVFAISRERLTAKLKQDSAFAARFYRALAVFLSHRLRVLTMKFRDGQSGPADKEADELDPDVLAGIYLGGRRFERMLKRMISTAETRH
jgi:CRP/FNR family transcriptional regulator, cyclic AMP receptor protein